MASGSVSDAVEIKVNPGSLKSVPKFRKRLSEPHERFCRMGPAPLVNGTRPKGQVLYAKLQQPAGLWEFILSSSMESGPILKSLEGRMRKLLIVCGLLLLGAACAKAQEGPGFEVSGNYQYVRFNPGNGASGINCQGGSGVFGAYLT